MTKAERIATAWKNGNSTPEATVIVNGAVNELYLGDVLVGGYYPATKTAVFFKLESRVKSEVCRQIKKYV